MSFTEVFYEMDESIFNKLMKTIRLNTNWTILLCLEALVCLGYNRSDIEASLDSAKYDDVFATYLLLGRKSTDVSIRVEIVTGITISCVKFLAGKWWIS